MRASLKTPFFWQLLVVIAVAAAVIFYKYNQIPLNLAYDEVELAKLALSLDGKAFTAYSQLADGHGTPYFYLMLAFFNVFGVSSFAMRLPSALFGIFNVILFFIILKAVFRDRKEWWVRLLPMLLSLTLLTQRWYFNFARFAFETPFLLFLELSAILSFIAWSLVPKRKLFFFDFAFTAGLAYNSYQPGRIFFLIPLFFLVVAKKFREAGMYILIVLLVALPMTLALVSESTKDPRFDQQFFLKNTELSIGEKAQFLTRNAISSTRMFIDKGDVSGRHNYPGKPAINPIIAILMFGGIIITLKNYRNFYNQLFLVWFIIALIPTNLTYPWENPNMLRTYTALPAIIYFVGQTIVFILEKTTKQRHKMLFAGIVALLFFSALYDLRTYFVYQSEIFPNAFERENDLQRNIDVDQRNQSARPIL